MLLGSQEETIAFICCGRKTFVNKVFVVSVRSTIIFVIIYPFIYLFIYFQFLLILILYRCIINDRDWLGFGNRSNQQRKEISPKTVEPGTNARLRYNFIKNPFSE